MEKKDSVCVTGGTGYLGSWLVMKLHNHGYYVNTTIRTNSPSGIRYICYNNRFEFIGEMTKLPGASDRLQIFHADLDEPQSFNAAIEGCIGVFHAAHPLDFQDEESEEVKLIKRTANGLLGILQSCLDSKTVRRVVLTSSTSAIVWNSENLNEMDENTWTDVDFVRRSKLYGSSYIITNTLIKKAASEFAEKHALALVSVVPSWIHGAFITPSCHVSVAVHMALLFGNKEHCSFLQRTSFVHIDDVVSAHIFLFEKQEAKGRYICSSVEITIDKLSKFLSARYPDYQIPIFDGISSKKLLDAGFNFKYGLEEIYDDAIECCKQKGFL
ncbi:dehydratase [Lithospermum erythrorhizon]|uniref:Dihydroflavonol 4-reductase n=1 Tax=Lithospermum erythrorhizon TaxID=34254 RepID=A0AAV3NT96_LITER